MGNVGSFEDRWVGWIITGLSSFIAAALMAGSIFGLYYIKPVHIRLVVVIVLIVVFALVLNLLTSASRDAIFAATAGYAAVMVVFISGGLTT